MYVGNRTIAKTPFMSIVVFGSEKRMTVMIHDLDREGAGRMLLVIVTASQG